MYYFLRWNRPKGTEYGTNYNDVDGSWTFKRNYKVYGRFCKRIIDSENSTNLINYMQQYVEHITKHPWKEINRLFMMVGARFQYVSEKVDKELNNRWF